MTPLTSFSGAQTPTFRRGDSAALNRCALFHLYGSISTCS